MSRYGQTNKGYDMENLYIDATRFAEEYKDEDSLSLLVQVFEDVISDTIYNRLNEQEGSLIEERDFYKNKYEEMEKVLNGGK